MQRPEAPERSGSGDQWLVEADGPQLRAMLGTLLHSSPLGIGLWDAELRFVFVNDAHGLGQVEGGRGVGDVLAAGELGLAHLVEGVVGGVEVAVDDRLGVGLGRVGQLLLGVG